MFPKMEAIENMMKPTKTKEQDRKTDNRSGACLEFALPREISR
jgi:hypothetical protein